MSAYELIDYGYSDGVDLQSDADLSGNGNTPPLVSDRPETSVGSPFSGLQNILGSTGDVARQVSATARDLGTAVGTIRRAVDNAGTEYTTARVNATQGRTLAQWWQYATTQDKVMVGLTVAGVLVGIVALVKD